MNSNATPNDSELALLEELIHAKSGLVLKSRRSDLLSHVTTLLKETGSHTVFELYQLLSSDYKGHQHLTKLINSLTIGETHFFRNSPQFEALERQILPELIARNRHSKSLRIWSAGCATGEEPYSLAILLHKLLPDLASWKIQLLATDINDDSLNKARLGLYGSWSFRQVPQPVMDRYFVPSEKKFKIRPEVASLVTFAPLNLVAPMYPLPFNQPMSMDLILCRNVFIYFDEATIGRIVRRFHTALGSTGWLIVGHSEPSQLLFGDFFPCDFPGTVIYRKTPLPSASSATATVQVPGLSVTPLAFDPVGVWNDSSGLALSTPATSTHAAQPSERESTAKGPIPSHAEVEQLILDKRLDAATNALSRMLDGNPDDARANYLRARIHANRKEPGPARTHLDRALAINALDADFHFLNGLLLNEDCKEEAAFDAFRRSTYLNPELFLPHYFMSLYLTKKGQRSRAQKTIERVAISIQNKKSDDLVPGGDGLTVGHAKEMISNGRWV
ncbi:MAG: CheR family methyltransferase [Planctomycetota bacterium]